MNISVERVANEATIKIELPAAEVNKGFAKAVQKIAGQVNIPGFRKGKAPRSILERHVGKEAIQQEAFEIRNDQRTGKSGNSLRSLECGAGRSARHRL